MPHWRAVYRVGDRAEHDVGFYGADFVDAKRRHVASSHAFGVGCDTNLALEAVEQWCLIGGQLEIDAQRRARRSICG